ncbi:NGRN protein, partial [Ramphastos sulfuratus]|nr:NGRN protein [Ramphastos sulfuratus]
GLRTAALLLRGAQRRALAWTGDMDPPDSEPKEAERYEAAGDRKWDRHRRPGAHFSPRRARRRRRAARMQMMRRELCEGRRAPERTLTWEAMEQMRFLRQELPEEWPLKRLAQSFGVSPDVVRRVLRSRSCPPPHRRQRQDQRALNASPGPGLTRTPGEGYEVRAPDKTLLYRLPRGRGGPGPGAQ